MEPVTTTAAFLQLLEKSQLLSERRLAKARGMAGEQLHLHVLANRLIMRRWLTTWQAMQILKGNSQFFFGKYRLLKVRGKGRMGIVFKARERGTGRLVALKIMSRRLLDRPRAVARFQREIRSISALDHPNIVCAYDAGRLGDAYFLAMEYISGRDLQEWSRVVREFPVAWSCECIRQAASGLQHAFERGVVHRDIKPSNLLVVGKSFPDTPSLKILDMGLVRFERESQQDGGLTRDGYTVGTMDYMSPEQFKSGRDADIRADIFSLGCTLYELLTRQPPFPGETVLDKLVARETKTPIPVSQIRPECTPGLDAVVAKMLSKHRELRYQTPIGVIEALAPFVIPRPIPPEHATANGGDTRLRTEPGRKRGVAGRLLQLMRPWSWMRPRTRTQRRP